TLLDSLDEAGVNDDPPVENLEVELDDIQIPAWLRAINDMRLSLAVRLGINSEGDATGLEQTVADARHPEAAAQDATGPEDSEQTLREVYLWLGDVQEAVVGAFDWRPCVPGRTSDCCPPQRDNSGPCAPHRPP